MERLGRAILISTALSPTVSGGGSSVDRWVAWSVSLVTMAPKHRYDVVPMIFQRVRRNVRCDGQVQQLAPRHLGNGSGPRQVV